MVNNDTFVTDVKVFIDGTKRKQDNFMKQLTSAVLKEIVIGTPVDTGFARASWYISIGNPDKSGAEYGMIENPNYMSPRRNGPGIDYTKEIPDVSAVLAANTANNVNALKAIQANGPIIYLINSAHYIYELEINHKDKAGFTRNAVARAQEIADALLAKYAAKSAQQALSEAEPTLETPP